MSIKEDELGLVNEKAWKKVVDMNCCSWYGMSTCWAATNIMISLKGGEDPVVAHRWMHGIGLSGQQAAYVAQAVEEHSTRGKEFIEWWDKNHG